MNPGLICGLCKGDQRFNDVKVLLEHYRTAHNPQDSYPCGHCGKRFIHKTSLTRHLTTAHRNLSIGRASTSRGDVPLQHRLPPVVQHVDDSDTISVCDVNEENEEEADDVGCPSGLSIQEELNKAAVQLLLDLRSSASLTGKAIERFENGAFRMIKRLCAGVKRNVTHKLLEKGVSEEDIDEVLEDLDKVADPFHNLKTIEDQLNYFSEKMGLVKPEEKFLDTRIDKRLDPRSNVYVPTQVSESFMYVSITDTLKTILSNKNVRGRIFKDLSSKDGVLRSYADGAHFKNHPFLLKHKDVVQILLFYDELETASALGSKTIIHKLATFFFQILNLPPELASELASIHLLILAHADDMKKPNGFKKILVPFIHELQKLTSDEGIEIDLDGETFVLRALLVALTADTLAAHDLLGFLGVGARHFCRKCLVSRSEVRADGNAEAVLRTPELHQDHVQQVTAQPKFSTMCGVKRDCPLNSVPYFHCTENTVFDAFHDLLEGVVPLVIKLVLRHYVTQSKLFSVVDFNVRVESFDYGFPDARNRPSPNFTMDMLTTAKGKLKQTGTQMWCLMRALPLVLGDKIAEGDEHMQLIFLLQDIMKIVFAFEVRVEDLTCLRSLVFDHNVAFKRLFIDSVENSQFLEEDVEDVLLDEETREADENEEAVDDPEPRGEEVHQPKPPKKPFKVHITNKLHHLTHYDEMIRMYGPAVRMWCAKFEGRMKIFRQHAAVCNNFKNIPKTMARMFQLSNLKALIADSADRAIEYQQGKVFEAVHSIHFGLLVDNVRASSEVIYTNSATLNGEEYRPGLFVCLPSPADNLSFALIHNVVVANRKAIYLIVRPWKNQGLSSRFNVFHLVSDEDAELVAVNVISLPNFRCIAPWSAGEESNDVYVSLRTIVF